MRYKIGDYIIIEELNKPTLIKEDEGISIDSSKFPNPLKYYQNNLQGKTVYNQYLGNIELTKMGKKETEFRSPHKYLAVICFIDKIIQTGYSNGLPENLQHIRRDAISNFYSIYNEILYDGTPIGLTIIIAEDPFRKKYYMFRAYKQNESLHSTSQGVPRRELSRLYEANYIITQRETNVNYQNIFKSLNEELKTLIGEI